MVYLSFWLSKKIKFVRYEVDLFFLLRLCGDVVGADA
ncbi:MAG: hypothetical protein RLZZ455_338 [Candidatus Parcubacteria bacterium]|jgi:hypothetical protein